jgi:hypothetical protein
VRRTESRERGGFFSELSSSCDSSGAAENGPKKTAEKRKVVAGRARLGNARVRRRCSRRSSRGLALVPATERAGGGLPAGRGGFTPAPHPEPSHADTELGNGPKGLPGSARARRGRCFATCARGCVKKKRKKDRPRNTELSPIQFRNRGRSVRYFKAPGGGKQPRGAGTPVTFHHPRRFPRQFMPQPNPTPTRRGG